MEIIVYSSRMMAGKDGDGSDEGVSLGVYEDMKHSSRLEEFGSQLVKANDLVDLKKVLIFFWIIQDKKRGQWRWE
jgi:hypothetical protein